MAKEYIDKFLTDRFLAEEELRQDIYSTIDCSPSDSWDDKEYILWDKLHQAACNLGIFYEKKGFSPWKH